MKLLAKREQALVAFVLMAAGCSIATCFRPQLAPFALRPKILSCSFPFAVGLEPGAIVAIPEDPRVRTRRTIAYLIRKDPWAYRVTFTSD